VLHETVHRRRSLPRQPQQGHGPSDDQRKEIADDGNHHAKHQQPHQDGQTPTAGPRCTAGRALPAAAGRFGGRRLDAPRPPGAAARAEGAAVGDSGPRDTGRDPDAPVADVDLGAPRADAGTDAALAHIDPDAGRDLDALAKAEAHVRGDPSMNPWADNATPADSSWGEQGSDPGVRSRRPARVWG